MNEKPFELHIYIIVRYLLGLLKFQNTFQVHVDLVLLHGDVFQLLYQHLLNLLDIHFSYLVHYQLVELENNHLLYLVYDPYFHFHIFLPELYGPSVLSISKTSFIHFILNSYIIKYKKFRLWTKISFITYTCFF